MTLLAAFPRIWRPPGTLTRMRKDVAGREWPVANPMPSGQPRLILWRRDLQISMGVSPRTLSRMVSNRDIPGQDVVIRGRKGWKTQTIQAWIDAGCPKGSLTPCA